MSTTTIKSPSDIKCCCRCNVVKKIDDFYRHPMTADRHLNICKECKKSYQKERVLIGLTQSIDRKRYYANPVRRLQAKRQALQWAKKNPEKRKAHGVLRRALLSGRITIQPCEICGQKAQAHHDDYSKPLDVRWLCSLHHARLHSWGEAIHAIL